MTVAKPEEQRRLEGYPDHRPPRTAVLIGGRIAPDELETVKPPSGFTLVEARAWRAIIAPPPGGVPGTGPGGGATLAGAAAPGSPGTARGGGGAGDRGRVPPPRGRPRVVGDDADPA